MAVILSNQIGDIRGRIGNQVYSRNKHGNFVRSWVQPVQPNSVPQQRAKSAFGQAITGYRTLSSKNKAKWQEYADNYFIPKQRNYTKGYSGFDAYVSLHNAVNMALQLTHTYDITVNGSPPSGGTNRNGWISAFNDPPLTAFVNFSKESGVIPRAVPWWLADASVNENAVFDLKIELGSKVPRTLDSFTDWWGNRIGFAVYMSNGNPSDNMSYKRPMQYCLGYYEPPEFVTPDPDLVNVDYINITNTSQIIPGEYTNFPLQGEFVRLTLYFISTRGQLIRVGTKEVPVDSA